MQLESQHELIGRAIAGDRLAAERLIERHRPGVTALAYQALGNVDDANDVAQEALVYAVSRLARLDDRSRLVAWLRQLTLSHCADYRRRRGTRRLGEPLTVLSEGREEADFAQRLAIHQAVGQLSDALRTTLLMHYVGGWSIDEVGRLLGVPRNTVRSRLMAAKRLLRLDLQPLSSAPQARKRMPTQTHSLPHSHSSLIDSAFPGARILSVIDNPEPWMPFSPRVQLALPDGAERTVEFRGDLDPERTALIQALERLGIPGPRVINAPVQSEQGPLTLCEAARGENLTLWALGGTPHRIRLATERAFEGIDRLHGCTEGLLADPVGSRLPRKTLLDEVAILTDDEKWNADPWLAEEGRHRHAWLKDPWFQDAVQKVQRAVADIDTPLVYTDYTFFFPQGYRIEPATKVFEEPLGWPGDPSYQENPLVEFAYLFGHFGDPLLGLAMVWVYDCYPFVHTGFVEQFLWRRGASRREFAPRLTLKALQMIARHLPPERPSEGAAFWDGLHGWAEQGLDWM
jgi:RNA polymerase sigma-70 factor (ECF subfamily)